MLAQYFAGNTLPRGTARCGVTAIGKGKGRIIALETEHFEEILGFRQLELRCDALGKCPRFQQAILRLVEFLVGNTSLALDPLKIDRKSTRRTPVTNAHLVCRLLLEKKKNATRLYKTARTLL